MGSKGILIPIGGNEDKGPDVNEAYSLDFVKSGILSRVVWESGGIKAKIIVITTASQIPLEVGENYYKAFTRLGCSNLSILHIQEREDAERPEWLELLRAADCVMFSGGDQSRIVDIIGNSTFHKILHERYKSDKLVIAGTSAGAMAMSSEMISGGRSTEALKKNSVMMRDGMDFIPELIIDTHFIQRGRFGRMVGALARFPELLGIGLAENTGLIIKDDTDVTVIGSGMVIIFDGKKILHNNEKILPEGMPMTVSNLKVHVLANSDKFNISTRTLHVLPIDADFE